MWVLSHLAIVYSESLDLWLSGWNSILRWRHDYLLQGRAALVLLSALHCAQAFLLLVDDLLFLLFDNALKNVLNTLLGVSHVSISFKLGVVALCLLGYAVAEETS